jgi:hypothetical protein
MYLRTINYKIETIETCGRDQQFKGFNTPSQILYEGKYEIYDHEQY